jgi:hypothetical protein
MFGFVNNHQGLLNQNTLKNDLNYIYLYNLIYFKYLNTF